MPSTVSPSGGTWLDANRPVAQRPVASLAPIKHDNAFTEQLMRKDVKYDKQQGLDYARDYFVNEVWPDYPDVRPEQLADGLAKLSRRRISRNEYVL